MKPLRTIFHGYYFVCKWSGYVRLLIFGKNDSKNNCATWIAYLFFIFLLKCQEISTLLTH